MVPRFTNPALTGLQNSMSDGYDPNGMAENMATLERSRNEEDQYYRNALADAGSGVNAAATMQQHGGSMMQDAGMKTFLQALHERNAVIGPKSGFVGSDSTAYSPGGMRSASLDALYDIANKKAKAAGI